MSKRKKKNRLLGQVVMIVLPLFAVMTAAITWVVYTSTIDGFLEAQKEHMRSMLTNSGTLDYFFDDYQDPELQKWFYKAIKNCKAEFARELTEQEQKRYTEYASKPNMFENSWFREMPEDIRDLFIIQYQYYAYKNIDGMLKYYDNSEEFFIMDLSADDHGTVIFEYNKSDTVPKVKSHIDIDLDDHPVLKEMLDNGDEDLYFEQIDDFPYEGSKFIGYKLVKIGDDMKFVKGLVYDYDSLRHMLLKTLLRSLIAIIIGIVLILSVLIVFLHRRAIRPISEIEHALVDYTKDKSSSKIVAKMFKFYTDNEIGYLADVISDLALEIENYNKETARIAAEKERAQQELYEAEVQIMVSQIQPHFMYNALSSIAILCKLKPETAYEATITFSKYLRGNMDSLKQTEPVPFEVELEHLKKYLYIEKLRFADKLNIEYDIKATDFELPMLSIQPIVENAVKHGVGMKDEGGTVTIATKETDDAYEVIVSDDGVGFDMNAPKKDDGRSHVGMQNTKKRLKDMCGADIIITSEIGKGTTARVIIPKDNKEVEP